MVCYCLYAQAACLKSTSGLQQQQEWCRLPRHEASHLNNFAALVISQVLTPSGRNEVPLWASNRPVTSLNKASLLLSRDLNSLKDDEPAPMTAYDPTKQPLEYRLDISSCFSNQGGSLYLLQIVKNFSSHFPLAPFLYTAGICTQQEFGSRRLQKGLPATPTAGGAALQRNLQTQTARLWSILKWGINE